MPFNLDMENKFNIRKDQNELKGMLKEMRTLMKPPQVDVTNIETPQSPLTFQEAIIQLNDDDKHGSMLRFALASAKVNGYTDKNGKINRESLGRWYNDYKTFVGKQLDPGYELIKREDNN